MNPLEFVSSKVVASTMLADALSIEVDTSLADRCTCRFVPIPEKNMSSSRTNSVRMVAILAAVTSGMFAANLSAVVRVWTGQSPINGNFSQVYNWGNFPTLPNPPPGPGDDAAFSAPTATRSTVVFDASYNVANAIVSGSTIAGNYTFVSSGAGNGMTCSGVFQVNNTFGATALFINSGMGLTADQFQILTGNGVGVDGAGTSVYSPHQFMIEGTATLGVRTGSTVTAYMDQASTGIMLVNAATINATGLEMRGGGNLDIETGGVLNLKATVFGLPVDGSVRNGQLRLLSGGTLNFDGARKLEISNSGTFVLQQGWDLPAGGTLTAKAGGDITSSTYIDVGDSVSGFLTVDGSGSTFSSAGSTCDWGSNSTGNAVVTVSNSATASVLGLNLGINNGKAIANILSNGTLTVNSSLTAGGGATARQVELNVTGGNLTANSAVSFSNSSSLNIGPASSGGAANLTQGATFNPGSTLFWASGSLNIPSGKTLAIAGGLANLTVSGFALGNGVTIAVTGGGDLLATNYIDIASNASGPITGTLLVSGSGSTYTTAGNYSDLGRSVNNAGSMTFDTSAVGNFNAGLAIATSGGTGTLNVNAATVNVASTFTAGGIAGSLATVNLSNGGLLNLTSDATFAVGSTVNVSTGGVLNWASGKTLTFDKGKANLTVGGIAQPPGTTLRIINAGLFKTTNYYDMHTATLSIDGLNSSMDVSGTTTVDWANNISDVTTATISNSGTAFYRGGLRVGNSGTANITLTSSGLLRTVNTPMSLGGGASSNVVVNINGGILSSTGAGANVTMGQGSTINLDTGAILFDGSLTMTGNAKIISTNTLALKPIASGNLSMAPTAKIDLGRSMMTVDYTSGSQIDTIRDLIKNGFANGTFTGNGITSSLCLTIPKTRVGYIDDGNAITILAVNNGDTNFDGSVNFDDLLTLAQHYNLPAGQHWQDGEFTYDGAINFDDLLLLAQSYGAHPLNDGQTDMLGQSFASDFTLAMSMVPEPTSISLLAGATMLMRRRREI